MPKPSAPRNAHVCIFGRGIPLLSLYYLLERKGKCLEEVGLYIFPFFFGFLYGIVDCPAATLSALMPWACGAVRKLIAASSFIRRRYKRRHQEIYTIIKVTHVRNATGNISLLYSPPVFLPTFRALPCIIFSDS
jgi:hypothetical protein